MVNFTFNFLCAKELYGIRGGEGEVCLLFTIPLARGIEQLLRDDSNNVGEGKLEKRGQEESEVKVSGTRRFVVLCGEVGRSG